jgi:proline racemase
VQLTNMVTAVDAHAAGEPGRVVTGGVLDVPGATMFEKMTYFKTQRDDLRRRLLREPRGYPGLCANVILPPTLPEADAGFIIMEQAEYAAMSGSNTICVVTVLLETGMLPMHEPVTELTLEAPAGLVRVRADCRDGKVTAVTFQNVPAFAVHLEAPVEVPGLGTVTVDVAYGGMVYAIVEASALGLQLTPDEGRDICRLGEMVKVAAREQIPVVHPENPEISGPTLIVISAPATRLDATSKNTVVISTGTPKWENPSSWTGVLDRSPCGTGTCAKMATLYAKGRLGLNEDFVHEGILGTVFTGRLIAETQVGPYQAVVPTLSGTGWITGIAQYALDPSDPFPEGYTVGDIWGSNV